MLRLSRLLEIDIFPPAVIALLLFIPLYPKFPLLNVPKTYVAIRVEDFLVGGIILLWFLIEVKRGFPSFQERVGHLILLYWAVGALSLMSALWLTKNIIPHLAFLHWWRRVEYMSLFFVGFTSVKDLKTLRNYGVVLFLASVGVGLYALGQKFLQWPVVSTMNEEFSKGMLLRLTEWARVNSTFAGHYDLAAFLVLVLALVTGFVIGVKNRWAKIGIGMVGFLSFYILILTASRVSFVAYLIAVSSVLLFLRKYWWLGPVLTLSLLVMFFSSEISQRYALTFNLNFSPFIKRFSEEPQTLKVVLIPTSTPSPLPPPPPQVVEKRPVSQIQRDVSLLPTLTPTATPAAISKEWRRPTAEVAVEYSTGIRFQVEWPRAIRAFLKNPFLGTGYSSVTLATDNDYLRLLAETGFLGFLSFALIFLEIGRKVVVYLQKAKFGLKKAVVAGIAGATLGFLANALFIDVFEASKLAFIFWTWMGILIGAIRLGEKKALDYEED